MTLRLLSLIAVALGAQFAAVPAEATGFPTAARLVQFCASEAADYQDGFCSGYIIGFAYGLDGRPGTGVCVPSTITARAVRDKVMSYLHAHPRVLQQDAPVVLPAALSAAFPCRK